METLTVDLTTMYGDHHVTEVRRILFDIPGVEDLYASSSFHQVQITFDKKKTSEKEIMELNHADIGGQVMKNWNIPLPITVAVKYHHLPLNERKGSAFSQDLIVDIIRLSNVICRRERIGYSGDTIIPEITRELWDRLDIDQKSINEVIENCGEKIEKAGILLELAG